MKIAIIGCGSMGLLLATRISRAGYKPLLICRRPEQAILLNEKGVRIKGRDEGTAVVSAIDLSHVALPQKHDIVIVAVKAYDTPSTLHPIRSVLGKDGVCITIQNGIGPYEYLKAELGNQIPVMQGLLYVGARRINDITIEYAGGDRVVLGPREEQVEILSELLNNAGFRVEVVDDIEPYRWEKLAINAAINPLTALLGVTNGVLLNSDHLLNVAFTIAREVELVARSFSIYIPRPVELIVKETIKATSSNKSSMLQDIEAKKPTEIDFINGIVTRMALSNGLRVPYNEMMYLLIKGLENILDIEVRQEWSSIERMLKLSLQRWRRQRK